MMFYEYHIDGGELLQDFLTDYEDLYGAIENCILTLENQPSDHEVLNSLFRAVHTIKGNCGLLGIEPPAILLQDLESVLDQVRSGMLCFQAGLGDLVLLVMDRCTDFFNQLAKALSVEYDDELFQLIAQRIQLFCHASEAQRSERLGDALALLDPQTTLDNSHSSPGQVLLDKFQIPINEDLLYIYSVAENAQSRAQFWDGRLNRVLNYVMSLNEYTGHSVASEQLFVAACMHDIAMSMLPTAVLHKTEALTASETQIIQEHVWVASRLISTFSQWKDAKRIIDQHQEHFDGQGYPLGLQGTSICTGAQFLAIVHTFEAIAYGYTKSLSRRRPFMRAVMELNRFSGSQFNPKWVEAFMEVTRAYDG